MVEEEDIQDVGGGRGMHRVERKDSSCQVEVPVHVAGRRDKLLERTGSILSSSILEVCWEETTTITVAAAVITTTVVDSMEASTTVEDSTTMVEALMEASTTTTVEDSTTITTTTGSVSATTASTSVINTTTFMELVKVEITLVESGVTLQGGITRAVMTYSHLIGIRTILGLTMPALIMVSGKEWRKKCSLYK